MTRIGEIMRLYTYIEAPVSRFRDPTLYAEWRDRALAWAGDTDTYDLHQHVKALTN